ncbi:hypothetical protein P154DRAFT_573084 [Amniculicola lignicola CBS 123094]|uniref:Uncharacterized protein n=1 Tax=Amniculicola lignicola CBS 123094 TaxID=1392246 RepID=A0A6A5WWL2_9PLEO|nr:hypothetical protein P154DRAFT_573084 [Amniculicola lignicola CBS 123094]
MRPFQLLAAPLLIASPAFAIPLASRAVGDNKSVFLGHPIDAAVDVICKHFATKEMNWNTYYGDYFCAEGIAGLYYDIYIQKISTHEKHYPSDTHELEHGHFCRDALKEAIGRIPGGLKSDEFIANYADRLPWEFQVTKLVNPSFAPKNCLYIQPAVLRQHQLHNIMHQQALHERAAWKHSRVARGAKLGKYQYATHGTHVF